MTLRELIQRTSFKSCFNVIYKNHYKAYPVDKIMQYSQKFGDIFNKLLKLKINKNDNLKIFITEREEITFEGEEAEKVTDVCILDEEKDELSAMDFISWEDLIDLEVFNAINLPNEEVLAAILWEITFWGFDEETIQKEKNKLQEAIDETNCEILSMDELIQYTKK